MIWSRVIVVEKKLEGHWSKPRRDYVVRADNLGRHNTYQVPGNYKGQNKTKGKASAEIQGEMGGTLDIYEGLSGGIHN